jgi:hypothetical protein
MIKVEKEKARYGLTKGYGYDLETALSRIESMKEILGYQIRTIDEGNLESEKVTTLPFLRGMYEEVMYLEDILATMDGKDSKVEV